MVQHSGLFQAIQHLNKPKGYRQCPKSADLLKVDASNRSLQCNPHLKPYVLILC